MEGLAELLKELCTIYLLFGILLYLPEDKDMKRVLRFCLSVLLFSVILQKILP